MEKRTVKLISRVGPALYRVSLRIGIVDDTYLCGAGRLWVNLGAMTWEIHVRYEGGSILVSERDLTRIAGYITDDTHDRLGLSDDALNQIETEIAKAIDPDGALGIASLFA
jgi:hypothetical protein